MNDWDDDLIWEWDPFEDDHEFLLEMAAELAGLVFLNDRGYLPSDGEEYDLGYLRPEDWWPLVNQLAEIVELESVLGLLEELDELLELDGLPSELLESPLVFLSGVLDGHLPREPSGRRVGSRRLVKIARLVVDLVREFPDTAQAAVRAWADVYRNKLGAMDIDEFDELDLADLLFAADLPPALTGFSMMIGLTLMHWPERAEGLPLPPGFLDAELYGQVLAQWVDLPDSPTVTEEGAGEAEALFAQGQMAYLLAQMGTVELLAAEEADELGEEDLALAYSRLSRAILWIHNQCRHCPECVGIACQVASNWPKRPVPLLDVAGEVANTGRVGGCVKMNHE